MRQGRGTSAASGLGAVLLVVGVVVGIIGAVLVGRWSSSSLAAAAYSIAEGREAWSVALTMLPPLVLLLAGFALLRRARGDRTTTGAAATLLVVAAVLSLGFLPGKHDRGRRSAAFDDAVGTYGSGDLFVAVGWVLLPALLLTSWLVLSGFPELRTRAQRRLRPGRPDRPGSSTRGWIVRGVAVIGLWSGLGALVVVLVDAPAARTTWLTGTAAHLHEGEAFYDDWDPGLAADVAEVTTCDAAAEALRLAGRVPDLDGCREALLVHATGRYGPGRATSGELTAVVVRTSTLDQLAVLDDALEGVTLTAAHGLPAPSTPTGPPLVTRAEAAYSLVIAAEDPGDIPHPAEGAEAVPLTRALAWTLIGEAQGLHAIPG